MKRYIIYKVVTLAILLAVALVPVQGQPRFSQKHGICRSSFLLKIFRSDPSHAIYYTTDGSVPTPKSKEYTAIFKVEHTTILRAAEYEGDSLCGPIATASYIFIADVLKQPQLPEGYPQTWGKFSTISGTAPADYAMDPEITSNRTYSTRIKNGFDKLPILSIVTDRNNLFSKEKDEQKGGIYIYTGTSDNDGRGWERPASVEIIGGSEGHDLSVNCGLKIHGGQGRVSEKNPKHSFRLTFKEEYGPGTLHYPIFGEEMTSKFNSLIVRTFYNYSWVHSDATQRSRAQYTRDLWARRMQMRMGYPTSNGTYIHVFINGLYWGLYNLAERIDDNYCKFHFGGKKQDYDVVKREDVLEASEGNLDMWNELQRLSATAANMDTYRIIVGQQAPTVEEETQTYLDVDNFIDYMLINQYGGNNDWDQHNWIAFNNRQDRTQGFRFICWDSEQTLYNVSNNVLGTNNKDCPTRLFNNLIKNPVFLHRFMDRAYQLLEARNGLLRPEKAVELWDSLQAVIELPLYAESARWGDYRLNVHPYTTKGERYTPDVQHAKENARLHEQFFPQRTSTLISQLKSKGWYPRQQAPTFLINGQEAADGDTLCLGDILTLSDPGCTIYYTTDGTAPASWEESSKGVPTYTSKAYDGEDLASAFPDADEITIHTIGLNGSNWSAAVSATFHLSDEDVTQIAATPNYAKPAPLYDLSGRRTDGRRSGIVIQDGKLKAIWR